MTDKGPSRGRKQCSTCLKYVGVRQRICPHCNAEFKVKQPSETKPEEVQPITQNLPGYTGGNIVYTPGVGYPNRGSICPIEPLGDSDNNIKNWVKDLINFAKENEFYYHQDAIKYIARQCWTDHNRVNRLIEEVYNEMD